MSKLCLTTNLTMLPLTTRALIHQENSYSQRFYDHISNLNEMYVDFCDWLMFRKRNLVQLVRIIIQAPWIRTFSQT